LGAGRRPQRDLAVAFGGDWRGGESAPSEPSWAVPPPPLGGRGVRIAGGGAAAPVGLAGGP